MAFGLRMQKTPAAEITPRVTETLKMVQLEELGGGMQAEGMAVIATFCCLLLGYPFAFNSGALTEKKSAAAAVSTDCAVLDQLTNPQLRAENFSEYTRPSE